MPTPADPVVTADPSSLLRVPEVAGTGLPESHPLVEVLQRASATRTLRLVGFAKTTAGSDLVCIYPLLRDLSVWYEISVRDILAWVNPETLLEPTVFLVRPDAPAKLCREGTTADLAVPLAGAPVETQSLETRALEVNLPGGARRGKLDLEPISTHTIPCPIPPP